MASIELCRYFLGKSADLMRKSTCVCYRARRTNGDKAPICAHCQEERLCSNTLLGIARHALDGGRLRRCARPTTDSNFKSLIDKHSNTLVYVDLIAAQRSAPEGILFIWPFLRNLNVEGDIKSFPLQATAMQAPAGAPKPADLPEQRQDRVIELCEDFLRDVHIRNPIIEVSEFRRYARDVDEHGPGWDGPGCFILLACALAKLNWHWYNGTTARQLAKQELRFYPSSIPYSEIREAKAEEFFNEAQRRLGILPNSLMAIQCTYLAGLYEQFVMRPLDAWHRFLNVLTRLQISHQLFPNSASHEEQGDRRIQHCIYWLCIKAERELRAELQLPVLLPFTLQEFVPPEPVSMSEEEIDASLAEFSQISYLYEYPDVQWWCSMAYHEVEIPLRGIMNRAVNALHVEGGLDWVPEITKYIKICAAYSGELESWREDLSPLLEFPPPISKTWVYPNAARNMLSFLLQVNYLCVIELLHRPFIYCILERGEYSDPADHPLIFSLARQYLDANSALIKLISCSYFRHESTWTFVRRSFACSLVLLSAVRYNLRFSDLLELPQDWRTVLSMSMVTIQRWERSGAKDVTWMRRTLEHMIEVVEK